MSVDAGSRDPIRGSWWLALHIAYLVRRRRRRRSMFWLALASGQSTTRVADTRRDASFRTWDTEIRVGSRRDFTMLTLLAACCLLILCCKISLVCGKHMDSIKVETWRRGHYDGSWGRGGRERERPILNITLIFGRTPTLEFLVQIRAEVSVSQNLWENYIVSGRKYRSSGDVIWNSGVGMRF